MQEKKNTKEDILRQLYHHAATFWGIRDIEDLDPLVQMLMQGLASLVYDTRNEINEMSVRVLESLASVLTPSVLTNPFPAHSVAQASPTEPVFFLDRKNTFFDKKIPPELRERGIKSLSFAPVKRVRLVSGKIKYLICERDFYRMENGERRPAGQARTPGEKTNYTLWIGLDLHPEVETLRGLSFYIDFPHAVNKYDKYSVLPYSKWSAGGQPLEIRAGLPSLHEENGDGALFPEHDPLNRIDKTIADIYNVQFLTVAGDVRLQAIPREPFPVEITGLFPEHVTGQTEPCYWIKAVFPAYITMQDIHDMTVHINTFPVAQKTLYSITHNMAGRGLTGIIPLRTQHEGEYFIGVEQLDDSSGDIYRALPYTTGQNRQTGTYSIKRGGIERFDRRDASELMERLIDRLRDEAAAFSSLDADSLRGAIGRMQENLRQLEIKYEDNPVRGFSIPDYLLLNRDRDNHAEILFAEYWATHCETANGLRAGRILEPSASLPVAKDSCRLASATRGGKFPADISGKMDAFRYALTARDQLVTREDIVNFFRYELRSKVMEVNVTKGVAVSSRPKEGLIRTTDIYLTPSPGYEAIIAEMQSDLLVMLRGKSPDTYNFRIIVENKN
ncbi:MAG: type VI secretion system baseplate subunit TssF [Dysgonamonadaceae bacterium]|jgi:hypothetical protein|nr:type VI secretion system baseplate subunit TssF [Dysgonamonadaceae bacterium]